MFLDIYPSRDVPRPERHNEQEQEIAQTCPAPGLALRSEVGIIVVHVDVRKKSQPASQPSLFSFFAENGWTLLRLDHN